MAKIRLIYIIYIKLYRCFFVLAILIIYYVNSILNKEIIMTLESISSVIDGINAANKILIVAHEKPDGDAIGSALALSRILNNNGKEAVLVGFEPLARRYKFLVNDYEIMPADTGHLSRYDLIIVLDCGDIKRVGEFALYAQGRIPFVNIDHHQANAMFGTYNWVDPEYSSTGEMVYQLAKEAEYDIPVSIGEPLWVAITTDTGNFNYSNTTPRLLRFASEILDLGVNPSIIRKELYECIERKELELQRLILDSINTFAGGKIAILSAQKDDFIETGCTPQHLHDPVNIGLSILGVELAAFIYEQPFEDSIKVSLRSYPPYNVASICREFGGGGHERAAGCSFIGTTLEHVVETLKIRLEQVIESSI